MMKQAIFGLSLVLLAACKGGAPAQTAADAPKTGSIFFYKASMQGKPGTVFVLGSAHLRHEGSALDRAITDAATTCERGAFELDLEALDQNAAKELIQREGTLPAGKTLKDVVSADTYAAWAKATDEHKMNREKLDHLRPWLAAMVLGLATMKDDGTSPGEGVDKMLFAFEKQEPSKKRTIIGLETAAEQLAIFQNTSAEQQDAMLKAAAAPKKDDDAAGKIISLYESGNEAGLAALVDEPGEDSFKAALIDKRNVSMTEKVAAMFDQPGCTVVTVGAGHVVGSKGIVQRLHDKGFAVERVAAQGPADEAHMAFAIPAPKEFVSPEDGFSAETIGAPTKQDVPIPGSDKPGHAWVFSHGGVSTTTLAVQPISSAEASQKVAKGLPVVLSSTLQKLGLTPSKPTAIKIQGEQALRASGEPGPNASVRHAEAVAIVHKQRLYLFINAQSAESDAAKDAEVFTKFLSTVKFR